MKIQEGKITPLKQDVLAKQDEASKRNKEESKRNKASKGGRPVRFPNGTKQVRLPVELIDVVDLILTKLYPNPSDGSYDPDKVDNYINEIKDMFDK